MSEERLKSLYARALELRADDGCPVPPEMMLAVLEQTLPEEQRTQALLAIMSNPKCREAFDLLRAVVEQAPPGAKLPLPRWYTSPLAIAAALVLALGTAAGVTTWLGSGQQDVVRGGTGGAALLLTQPAPVVASATGLAFAWRPIAGVTRYDYNLATKDGRAVFVGAVSDTILTLPDSVRLRSTVEYRWWVEATLPIGVHVRSGVRPLRVEKP